MSIAWYALKLALLIIGLRLLVCLAIRMFFKSKRGSVDEILAGMLQYLQRKRVGLFAELIYFPPFHVNLNVLLPHLVKAVENHRLRWDQLGDGKGMVLIFPDGALMISDELTTVILDQMGEAVAVLYPDNLAEESVPLLRQLVSLAKTCPGRSKGTTA